MEGLAEACTKCIGTTQELINDLLSDGEVGNDYNNFNSSDYEEYEQYEEVQNGTAGCSDEYKWRGERVFPFLLIPACLIILVLCFLKKRKQFKLDICGGRPGLTFPLNLLQERKDRFIYVAAFSVTSWSMLNVLFNDPTAVLINGNPKYKPLYLIITCVIYGFIYYPIFACVTTKHLISHVMGLIYTTIFMFIFWFQQNYCWTREYRYLMIELATDAPAFISLFVLVIYYFYLIVRIIFTKGSTHADSPNTFQQFLLNSYQAKYVRNVFMDKSNTVDVKKSAARRILDRIYCPIPGFEYSCAILSAVLLAFTFVYRGALLILSGYYFLLDMFDTLIKTAIKARRIGQTNPSLQFLGHFASLLGYDVNAVSLQFLEELQVWYRAFMTIFYISYAFVFILTILYLLTTLKNYRNDLILVGSGKYENFKRGGYAGSILISYAKFIGFQVGYSTWGFIIQFHILLAFGVALQVICFFIFRYENYWIIQSLLDRLWPVIVTLILVILSQHLMTFFFFITRSKKKNLLAINNRRLFFNYHFFATFANIAVGLVSCLLRIVFAIIFGIWMIPRLDKSTMSRTFERFDAGFNTFVALIKVENAHRNAILVSAVQIFIEAGRSAQNKDEMKQPMSQSFRRAVINWKVTYTLQCNPGLRLYRKHACPSSINDTDLIINKKNSRARAIQISPASEIYDKSTTPIEDVDIVPHV